jgi:hypothetical protein
MQVFACRIVLASRWTQCYADDILGKALWGEKNVRHLSRNQPWEVEKQCVDSDRCCGEELGIREHDLMECLATTKCRDKGCVQYEGWRRCLSQVSCMALQSDRVPTHAVDQSQGLINPHN